MKFELIDNQNRRKLGEGRGHGLSTALAKLKDDKTLETVIPITACKDFLNDQIYSEMTGKTFRAHGLQTSKQDIFNKEVGYLVLAVLGHNDDENTEYPNFQKDRKLLAENYLNLQKFINWFEKQLKIKNKTEIIQVDDNRYVAVFPKFWGGATYLISLYGLLLRVGMYYKSGDIMEFINTELKNVNHADYLMMNTIKDKIEQMFKGYIPKQDFTKNVYWHNEGIATFAF